MTPGSAGLQDDPAAGCRQLEDERPCGALGRGAGGARCADQVCCRRRRHDLSAGNAAGADGVDPQRFEGSARRPGLPRRGERRLHRRCRRRDAGRRRGDGRHRRPFGAARGARRARPHRARQGGGGAPRRAHRHRLRRRDGGRAQRRADRDGRSPAARRLVARCRDGRQHRRRLRAGVGDRHRPHAD